MQRKQIERGIAIDRLDGELWTTGRQKLESDAGLTRFGTVRLMPIAGLPDHQPAWVCQFDHADKLPVVARYSTPAEVRHSVPESVLDSGLEPALAIVISVFGTCETSDMRRREIAAIAPIVRCADIGTSK
jgi:hypothetical protein